MLPRSVKCALSALLAFGLVAGGSLTVHAQTTKDLVYCALSKNVREANGTAKYSKQYKCNVPPGPNGDPKEMRKITLALTMPFTPHDCDEDGLAGTIKTTWTILLRVGPAPAGGGFIPYGTLSGGGSYVDSVGNTIRLSFNGTIGCGTHRDPFMECERCREHLHVEGWLTGTYSAGPLYNLYVGMGLPAPKIKASFAGQLFGNLPTPTAPTQAMKGMFAIDGVYIFNCKP